MNRVTEPLANSKMATQVWLSNFSRGIEKKGYQGTNIEFSRDIFLIHYFLSILPILKIEVQGVPKNIGVCSTIEQNSFDKLSYFFSLLKDAYPDLDFEMKIVKSVQN